MHACTRAHNGHLRTSKMAAVMVLIQLDSPACSQPIQTSYLFLICDPVVAKKKELTNALSIASTPPFTIFRSRFALLLCRVGISRIEEELNAKRGIEETTACCARAIDCYELKIPEGERFAANSWFQNQAGPAFLQVDDATIFTQKLE